MLATLLLLLAGPLCAEDGAPITAEHKEFFEAKIRPILVNNCYECHATDAEDIEGGLVLDSRWGWETGGDSGPAIVPGKLDESLLIHAVRYEDDITSAMPPDSKLPAAQIKLLEQWVEMGAPDPRPKVAPAAGSTANTFDLQQRFAEHWSWRPIADPKPPQVNDAAWPLDDLDRFVLARLEAAKFKPARPADKQVWLRRVYFDVIGLPPTPAQIDAFLADESKDAYARVVQGLLDSPHFGEKWARHWMDLVRYAETYGHEFDYPISDPTEYRDYLIRAFNADVPFDQFVIEHIAGDLIESPRLHPTEQFNESIIGTGFWYFHEATHAPTDVLKNEADIIDNQIDVFGKAFLGLTVACARCHDHKFDAISTADYYALSAFIQSSCRQRYPLDPGKRIEQSITKMNDLRAQFRRAANQPPSDLPPDKYYQAAAILIKQAIENPALQGASSQVFDDFESDYSRWTVHGDAFGQQPATKSIAPQKEVVGKTGTAFVSSYAGSDQKKGSLISEPFVIQQRFIQLGVGGGKKKVGVELRVGDKVVQSAHGENREDLIPQVWDVKDLLGQTATIRIFDENEGGWGHVNVDRIVFTDSASTVGNPLPIPTSEVIAKAATEQQLDVEKLTRWIRLLAAGNPNAHPPQPIDVLAQRIVDPKGLQRTRERLQTSRSKSAEQIEQATLFADFDQSTLPTGWSVSGFAFQPTRQTLNLSPGGGYLPEPHTVDSGVFGTKATGILRSPTFTIDKPNIYVKLRATANVAMNVVIDNYQMGPHNGLLFRGTFMRGGQSDTKGQWQWKSFGGDLKKYIGHKAYLEFIDEGDATIAIDEIRFSDAGPPPIAADQLSLEFAKEDFSFDDRLARSGKTDDLLHWLRQNNLLDDVELASSARGAIEEFRQLAASLPHPRYVLAMAEGTRESANVYVRGSHTALGAEVPPRTLTALGGQSVSRLDLAKQIASADNPLVARVIVNRLWHHLFGRGIVATVDDFGPQGQPASHPLLLDHLATQFIADGWSIKQAIRKMVLSQTYRQASVANPETAAELIATSDPTNTLLHRMRVRRLPAESIRDGILAVSGRLDAKQFGGSVATYRTPFMTGRGARGSGPLDGAGRRSVYLSIYRNFLNPFLLSFDMPSPFGPKGGRSNSNVPAQALTLMNDPFVAEQAKFWADTELKQEQDREQRIAAMVRRAHGSAATDRQLEKLSEFVAKQLAANGNDEKQAWADLAHALFNMKSFYFLQ